MDRRAAGSRGDLMRNVPLVAIVVPLPGARQLWMARAGDPAIEEPLEIAPRDVLDGAREIAGLDRLVSVYRGVVANRPKEGFVTEDVPDHVHDPATLVVGMPIEKMNRFVIAARHDGALVAVGLGEVGVRI